MYPLADLRRDLTVVLLNLAALGFFVWQLRDARASAVRLVRPPTVTPAPTATAVALQVYVSGAVARPAVVTLYGDARIADCIEAAGGFAAEADRAGVNLAAPVADGQHIHVWFAGQVPGASSQVEPGASGAVPGVGPPPTAGSKTPPPARGTAPGADGTGLLNVNTATAAALESLPGIGPALAERIVAYREAHGLFASTRDLLRVSGIGEKTLARFQDLIAVR